MNKYLNNITLLLSVLAFPVAMVGSSAPSGQIPPVPKPKPPVVDDPQYYASKYVTQMADRIEDSGKINTEGLMPFFAAFLLKHIDANYGNDVVKKITTEEQEKRDKEISAKALLLQKELKEIDKIEKPKDLEDLRKYTEAVFGNLSYLSLVTLSQEQVKALRSAIADRYNPLFTEPAAPSDTPSDPVLVQSSGLGEDEDEKKKKDTPSTQQPEPLPIKNILSNPDQQLMALELMEQVTQQYATNSSEWMSLGEVLNSITKVDNTSSFNKSNIAFFVVAAAVASLLTPSFEKRLAAKKK